MSTLLISAPKDSTGGVTAIGGSSVPTEVSCGVPYEGTALSVDGSGAVTHHHMGLPFTAEGRLAVTSSTPTYYGSGGAPFAAGRLCMVDSTVSHYSGGMAYAATGPLSSVGLVIDGVTITDQPDDWLGDIDGTITFTLTAVSGDASPLSYQWQELTGAWNDLSDGGRISGATTGTLSISSAVLGDTGRTFRCRVSNTSPSTQFSSSVVATVAPSVADLLRVGGENLLTIAGINMTRIN